jgi:hypothetical protein
MHHASRFGDVFLNTAEVIFETHMELTQQSSYTPSPARRARDLHLYHSTEVFTRVEIGGAGLELILWFQSFLLAWKAPFCSA